MPEVSSKTLADSMKSYRKLKKKRFTLSVHIAISQIERQADEILNSYRNGFLKLKPGQYALFANYIDMFANSNKEEYHDLLQQEDGYDANAQVSSDTRSWWQKIFSKNETNGIKHLSAAQLQRQADKYISLHQAMEHDKPWYNFKVENMRAKAEEYINAYLKDKVTIEPEEAVAFKHYIRVMAYPIYEGGEGDLALKKLKQQYGDVLQQAKEGKEQPKAAKVPLWTRIKKATEAKIIDIRDNNKWYKRAAVAIAGLVAVGALWLGFKDDFSKAEKSTTKDKKIAKTEVRAKKIETKTSDEKMIHFSFVANEYKSTAPAAKQEKTVKKDNVVNYDSARLARINHHNHVLEMRLGEKKGKQLVNDIKAKMDKGVISLPQNLGAEDFAYAMEMYRAYGVDCSLHEALNSNKKLSQKQNRQVVEDIVAAGETGLGVKKMASAMNNGKLNHKSVYNRASKKSQKQHNMNMQQWFKAKKKVARAA